MTMLKYTRALVFGAFTLVSGASIGAESPKENPAPKAQKQECTLSARSVFGAAIASLFDAGEVKLQRRNIDGIGRSAGDSVQRQFSPECAPKSKENPVVLPPTGYVR
ncbi:MAG: hypothetical protein RBR86_09965 [Pseudobdellovibrionaceae bacterium]|nr:hypothetical protein [Pseudobdellovibrionaceae bacterium]